MQDLQHSTASPPSINPAPTQQKQSAPAYRPTKLQPMQIAKADESPDKHKPKNIFRLATIVTLITLAAFYFGFSLSYLSTIPKTTLVKFYGPLIISSNSTLPVLTGAMPVGGIFGALLANIVMRRFTRRNFLAFVNVLALTTNLIIQITNIWVLLICRLITGILVGLYMGIVSLYIKQITPRSLAGTFGAFTQLQHIFGVIVAYFFGMVFYLANYQGQFFMRFQLQFTSILVGLQMVCIVIGYIPQSPNSLLQADKVQQAKDVLRLFNDEETVEKLIAQKIIQNHQMQQQEQEQQTNNSTNNNNTVAKIQQSPSQLQANIQNQLIVKHKKKPQIQMTWRSYFLAFELPFTQQFTGVNFIVTQLTAITAIYDEPLSHYTALMANTIQFVATMLSAWLLVRVGRRTCLLAGNAAVGALDIFIGISFLLLDQKWRPGFGLSMALIMIFNVLYGLSLGPVVWLYIPEICKKKIVPLATATYWCGCSLCVIVAPIVTSIMNSPYAVFLFFGAYQLALFFPNYILVEETKGLSAEQISQKFKAKSQKK